VSPLLFAAALMAALSLRTCPKCGHKQQVRRSETHNIVRCHQCGENIPPRTTASRGHQPRS